MKRTIVVLGVAAIVAAVATPWVIGWRTEQLVRSRVAQVEGDRSAAIGLRIERYERGWRGANARLSVVERDGSPLLILPATITHWPFASGGGLADWVAAPELGSGVKNPLGAWGEKLPELTTRTRLSWRGDLVTEIESATFKRRVPEVPGGTLAIEAVTGRVDWRRDGALTYEIALPLLRVEQQPIGRNEPDVAEFKDAVLKGEGALGTVERRWTQTGSLRAASVSIIEAGKTIFNATTPLVTYASQDQGEHVDLQFGIAAGAVSARHALQSLSDAAIELQFDARHLAKQPLARLLDAAGAERSVAQPVPLRSGRAAKAADAEFVDLLRGSPAAELRFMLKAREGRAEFKLVLAFDGKDYEPRRSNWLQRLDGELNTRASTSLVLSGARAGASAAGGTRASASRAHAASDIPPVDPDAVARRQLDEAAAQGWIRIEGDEVATTVVWRDGRLTINQREMKELRDLARGLAER